MWACSKLIKGARNNFHFTWHSFLSYWYALANSATAKNFKSLALFKNLPDGVEHGQKCVGSKNGQHFNFTNFSKLETFMLGEKTFFSQKNS